MSGFQPWQLLVVTLAGWINRHQQDVIAYLQEENRVLKSKFKGKRIRFTDDERRRLAIRGKILGRKLLGEVASIVTPDSILAWHRKLIAKKYDSSSKRGPGRPRVKDEIPKLTVRMAQDNASWGYPTIRGALFNLGHEVARETIRNILKEHGIVPAPDRRKRTPWSTFLKAHWDSIAAADFFTVEIWTLAELTHYHVLFFIKPSNRRVYVAGITEYPYAARMQQVGRNMTDAFDGFLLNIRYVIPDRDPLYTDAVRQLLKKAGAKSVRLPPRSPNLNAYAERFVRTIKESCLDRMIFYGESSLRNAIREFWRAPVDRATCYVSPRASSSASGGRSEALRSVAQPAARAKKATASGAGGRDPKELCGRTRL